KRYQLYKKEKWATLMLHLAFILVLAGAFITRYISYEGKMRIREEAVESQFYSDKLFVTAMVDGEYKGEMKRRTFEKAVLLSPEMEKPWYISMLGSNYFAISEQFADTPFKIEYKDYKIGAKEIV